VQAYALQVADVGGKPQLSTGAAVDEVVDQARQPLRGQRARIRVVGKDRLGFERRRSAPFGGGG